MNILLVVPRDALQLSFFKTIPFQYLVDLRQKESHLAYDDGALPIFHSFDLLEDPSLGEQAMYDTKVEGLQAAFPPPQKAQLPQKIQLYPSDEDVLYLSNTPIDLPFDGKYWVGEGVPTDYIGVKTEKFAAVIMKKQGKGLFERLFSNKRSKE